MAKKVLERLMVGEVTLSKEVLNEENDLEKIHLMIYDEVLRLMHSDKMLDWMDTKFHTLPTHIDLRFSFVEQPYTKEDAMRTLKIVLSGSSE